MSDADVLTAALDATDESTQATATAPAGQCAPTHPRNPKAELIAIADSAPRGLATDTDDPNEVTASASISGSAQVLDSTSGSEQTGATSSATSSATASASATPRKQFDTDFLRSVTWDDVVVINGELKTIGCVSIEDFKYVICEFFFMCLLNRCIHDDCMNERLVHALYYCTPRYIIAGVSIGFFVCSI